MKNAKTDYSNSKLNKENIDAVSMKNVNNLSVCINQIFNELAKLKDKH